MSSSITQIVSEALKDDGCMSAKECLKYLKDKEKFITPGQQLTRILVNAQIISEQEQDDTVRKVKILCKKLKPLSAEQEFERTVKKWFEPERKIPIEREYAIKLCFALELSFENSLDLLRKCAGSYGFNVRDPEDAIYMYCIISKQNYNAAQDLFNQYKEKCTDDSIISTEGENNSTVLLYNAIHGAAADNVEWETNEDFLNNFLLPNRNNFIMYSTTAHRAFSNILYDLRKKIALLALKDEELLLDGGGYINALEKYISDIPDDSRELKSYINSINDYNPSRKFNAIVKFLEKNEKTEAEMFVNKLVTVDAVIRETLYGIPYRWSEDINENEQDVSNDKKKPKADFYSFVGSSLNNEFNKSITRRGAIDGFIKKPSSEYSKSVTRKSFIFLYFINYVCDWSPKSKKRSKSYDEFYKFLTKSLKECGFADLYYDDPFDWLILKSVQQFQAFIDGEYKVNYKKENFDYPLHYFNQVIRLSYESGGFYMGI